MHRSCCKYDSFKSFYRDNGYETEATKFGQFAISLDFDVNRKNTNRNKQHKINALNSILLNDPLALIVKMHNGTESLNLIAILFEHCLINGLVKR